MGNKNLPDGSKTVLSVFGINPQSVSSTVEFIRELSRQLGEHGWNSVICYLEPPVEEVARQLALANVTISVFPEAWRTGRQQIATFWRLLRRYRPRILHLHFTGFINPYYWMARLNGVEGIFFTDHGSWPETHVSVRAPAWKRLWTRVINAPLSRVFSISKYCLQTFVALDILPEDRFQVMYNGTALAERPIPDESERRAFRQQCGIPEKRPIVMQVSWVIPEKGVQDLVEAASIVLSERSDAHFVVVGEGSHKEQYTRRVEELGIAGNFSFLGTITGSLAPAYAAASVVCQGSRWQEGFGATIIEAMSCGRPVVATRVGGIPEVVMENETGYLVPPASPYALAEKILALLNDSDLASRMGRAGRLRAEKKFSLTRNVAECLDAYGMYQHVKFGPSIRSNSS